MYLIKTQSASNVVAFLLPLLVILSVSLLALSPYLQQYPALAIGITYDLALTAPLLYLWLIWRKPIPKITVMPFFIGGLVLAGYLLPEQQQTHLDLLYTYLVPLVELTLVGAVIWGVRKSLKTIRREAQSIEDPLQLLRSSALKLLRSPIVAGVFTTELAMLYFAFIQWRRPSYPAHAFTNYKRNGLVAMFGAIIFIILFETFILHLLLAKWNEIVAWIVSISSIYVGVQIFAHIKALSRRPILLTDQHLMIRYGLFGDTTIPLDQIASVTLTKKHPGKDKMIQKMALLSELESHNLFIELHQPAILNWMYGTTKSFTGLLLYVDEAERLKERIEAQSAG